MDKLEIAEAVVKELQIRLDPADAVKIWWYPDHSKLTNARLTNPGYAAISRVMPEFEFEYEFEYTGNNIKKLSALQTPFYVSRGFISIFSPQLATMIKMYPSFERYMELINA